MILALSVVFAGCSSVAHWNQANTKAEASSYGGFTIDQLDGIKQGTKVELTFKNDVSLTGWFHGLEQMEPNDYRREYLEFLAETGSEMPLPKPGQRIIMEDISGQRMEANFIGFDYMRVGYMLETDSIVQWEFVSGLDKIIFDNNKAIDGETIGQLTSGGKIPLMSAVAIEDSSFRNLVAIHEINQIRISPRQ